MTDERVPEVTAKIPLRLTGPVAQPQEQQGEEDDDGR